ncbi:MAG: 5-formyltetrahydrofolate cyclo-ligase, partial [Clostridiaceae bacterium]|nr:5-formyltetrahydrofolate cyclo-ligase [Clostridiaceae bacterium]
SMDQLKKDNFGILSPDPNSCSKVLPEEIDLALIPLLAFNAQGYRLGYGKGYYDRYLPQLKATCNKIGIAFSEQLSKELPVSIYDYPLDHILTENGFLFITERIETHSHCAEFSPDSERSFEDLLLEANKKNYSYLTLTDHFDKDVIDGHVIRSDKDDLYTPRENEWIMPLSSYIDFCVQKKKELESKPDSTQLLIGIELGYQDYLLESFKQIVNQYPFDCVIGSIHTMFKYDFAVFSEPLYGLGKEKAYQA